MAITIELEDQKGLVDTGGLGVFEIDVGQWRVWGTNTDTGKRMHVGYLCKKEGSPFNGSLALGEMPDEIQKLITDAVKAKCGEVRCCVPLRYSELTEDEDADDDTDTIEDEADE